MAMRWSRAGVLGAAALGVLLLGMALVAVLGWEWDRAIFAAAALGAIAGPLGLLLALARLIPGGAPVRTAVLTAAGGIAAAGVLALVGRGGWGFVGLTLGAGIVIVLPVYLGVLGALAAGWTRNDEASLATARGAVQVAVVLGMLTWAVPLGSAVNAWDVRRAMAFAERLAAAVEEEKARSGTYPSHDGIQDLVRREGSPPILMGGLHYHASAGGFDIGFPDRTEMFGAYEFHGPEGGWSHWVD